MAAVGSSISTSLALESRVRAIATAWPGRRHLAHEIARPGPPPLYAPRNGREAVVGFFEALVDFDFLRFEPVAFLEGDDMVAVPIHLGLRHKASGREMHDLEVHLWTFGRDGLVKRLRHILDTRQFAMMVGLRGRAPVFDDVPHNLGRCRARQPFGSGGIGCGWRSTGHSWAGRHRTAWAHGIACGAVFAQLGAMRRSGGGAGRRIMATVDGLPHKAPN